MQYLFLPLQFIGKAVSAALFGILLLIAFALTASMGSHEYMGFYRYDYLLIYALIIQICLLYLCTRQISQNPYPIRILPS